TTVVQANVVWLESFPILPVPDKRNGHGRTRKSLPRRSATQIEHRDFVAGIVAVPATPHNQALMGVIGRTTTPWNDLMAAEAIFRSRGHRCVGVHAVRYVTQANRSHPSVRQLMPAGPGR